MSPLLAIVLGLAIFGAAGCGHHSNVAHAPGSTPSTQPKASSTSGPPPPIEHQPAVPGEYVEEGVASWYGIPFQGRHTSNGEIYDMHLYTAAHRTLPFNCVVRVTNLRNGKQTEVRINDRGPFVANRVIDLSLSAAQAIDMVGTGTAPVRLEIISGETPQQQPGYFGVQVGAFQVQENAERLKTQIGARYSPIGITVYDSPNGTLYRVRVGRLPTEDAAQQLADQLHTDEQLTTFVVRLDD